jgi:adenylate cyclase class 2
MSEDITTPMEAECKFRVEDHDATRRAIEQMGARFLVRENHCDTYLRHPSRDFRSTDEALRIREINGSPFITYKGPRLNGPIKIRPEIELPLAEGTLEEWLKIWQSLGFTIALAVRKQRDVFQYQMESRPFTITLDRVDELGWFAEIERILHHRSEVEQAELEIQQVAQLLGLREIEKRSYLGMLLARVGDQ